LTFVPIRFVHPLRVKHLRSLNIALMAAWAALALLAIIQNLVPGPYVTLPLMRHRRLFFFLPVFYADRINRSARCHDPFF